MIDLFRALAVLLEPPVPQTSRVARALRLSTAPSRSAYTELFLFQLYPYASVYVGAEGMLGGEARDRVAGFWRALRLTPPPEPDHLAALLGLYAELCHREAKASTDAQRGKWRKARGALLWEHLLSWLPPFLDKLEELCVAPYDQWARIGRDALCDETAFLGPPPQLPLHLRAAPAPLSPSDEPDEWIRAVLTPVRSGIILTRADLARAAGELRLGLRAGERRFMLRALLLQDRPAVTGWLRSEAARWEARHRSTPQGFAPVSAYWAGRAGRLEAGLGALQQMKENAHAGSADREAD